MLNRIKIMSIILAGLAGIGGLAFEQATYSVEANILELENHISLVDEELLVRSQTAAKVQDGLSRATLRAMDYALLDMTVQSVEENGLLFISDCEKVGKTLSKSIDKSGLEREFSQLSRVFNGTLKVPSDVNLVGLKGTGIFLNQELYESEAQHIQKFDQILSEFNATTNKNDESNLVKGLLFRGYARLASLSTNQASAVGWKIGKTRVVEGLKIKRQIFALGSILSSVLSLLFTFIFLRLALQERA